jgi:ferric-dicitrate binding protein FerR (iron transport regulator)
MRRQHPSRPDARRETEELADECAEMAPDSEPTAVWMLRREVDQLKAREEQRRDEYTSALEQRVEAYEARDRAEREREATELAAKSHDEQRSKREDQKERRARRQAIVLALIAGGFALATAILGYLHATR